MKTFICASFVQPFEPIPAGVPAYRVCGGPKDGAILLAPGMQTGDRVLIVADGQPHLYRIDPEGVRYQGPPVRTKVG